MSTYCKYYKQKKQVSYDNGNTWTDVSPAEYQKGELYSQQSADCNQSDNTNYFTIYPTSGNICVVIYIEKDGPVYSTDNETYMYQYRINNGNWIQETVKVSEGACCVCIPLNSGDTLKIRAITWNYPHPGGISKHLRIENISNNPYGVSGDVSTLTTSYFNQMSGATIGSLGYLFDSEDTLENANNLDVSNVIGNLSGCTGMFRYCAVNVNIPSGVTSIGDVALYNCNSLISITVNATTPPTIGYSAFDNTNNCPIYVPSGSVSAYQSAWSQYASRIQAKP